MSYLAIHQMTEDRDLLGRVTAAVALEGEHWPDGWVAQRRWLLVARTDWAEAWAYAVSAGNEKPGADPSVITDQMILSSVQKLRDGVPR